MTNHHTKFEMSSFIGSKVRELFNNLKIRPMYHDHAPLGVFSHRMDSSCVKENLKCLALLVPKLVKGRKM